MRLKNLWVKARKWLIFSFYRDGESRNQGSENRNRGSKNRNRGSESQCITELLLILYQKSRLHWEELLHPHRVFHIPIRKE